MTLQIQTAATPLLAALCKACAINPDGTPIPNGKADISTYASDFGQAYNAYAKQGVVLGSTNEGGNPSHLTSVLQRTTHVTTSEFAQAFALFWSEIALVKGPPGHGGVETVDVKNDALANVGLFQQAIEASLTTVESKPYYHRFLRNLETMAVKKIKWTVKEKYSDGSETEFVEYIE
jgi:hypothetical protein